MRFARRSMGGGNDGAIAGEKPAQGRDTAVAEMLRLLSGEDLAIHELGTPT